MRGTRDDRSHRLLVGLTGAGETDRVLDLACGPGFLTLAFAEQAGSVLGLDATEALLDVARGEAAARARALLEQSIEADLFDLHVRHEEGRLCFRYQGVAFLLRVPG